MSQLILLAIVVLKRKKINTFLMNQVNDEERKILTAEIPVRNEQCCCSAAEWLQEALQKSCKSAGLQQPQILAAVESPLTVINSTFAAVQKIPESRSALQSGCKVASKRQRMLLPVMPYHSLVQKKEMQAPIIQ